MLKRPRLVLPLAVLSIAACSGGPLATPSAPPTGAPPSPAGSPVQGQPSSTPPAPGATYSATPPSGASPPPSPSPAGRIPRPIGADELVLRVATGGGLAPQVARMTGIPSFSLYGDGRAIVQGPQIEIFPGPAMPPLIASRFSGEAMERLLGAARDAGLTGRDRDLRLPGLADGTTTTITVVADGAVHTTSVYGLYEGQGMMGRLPPDDRAARSAILTFTSQLADLHAVFGDEVGPDEPYTPAAVRVFAAPATGPGEPGIPAQVQAWPLADLASFGDPYPAGAGMRCGVVSGPDLDTMLPLFQSATQVTRWSSGDAQYQLTLRPLLPDESGCPQRDG